MIPSDPKQIRRAVVKTLNRPVVVLPGWVAGSLISGSLGLLISGWLGFTPLQMFDDRVTEATAPLLQAVSTPFRQVGQAVNDLARFNTLRQENAVLKLENERLRGWYAESMRLKAENQTLRSFNGLPLDVMPIFETTARVIADTGGPFAESVLVRRGIADGIQRGDVAISGGNVVGRVTAVMQNSARVLLIQDINARVPVVLQNSRHRGILAGTNGRELQLLYMDDEVTVSVGERLVTSGHGGVFGADIPVAIVTNVTPSFIHARPLRDISRLEMVKIVRFYE